MTKPNPKIDPSHQALTAATNPPPYVYDNIFFACNRGGMGKTTKAEYSIEVLRLLLLLFSVWEVDRNNRLTTLYGDLVTNIDVPDVHIATEDEIADTVAFAPLFAALCSPRDTGINIVDVGANMDERLTHAILDHGVDVGIDAAGRKTAILVLMDSQPESMAACILSVRMYAEALPNADIFVVQPVDNLNTEALFRDGQHSKLAAAYAQTITPLLNRGNLLVLPRLRNFVHDAYRAFNCSPMEFLQLRPAQIGEFLSPGSPPNTAYMIGQKMIRQFHPHFEIVKREFERKLGSQRCR